MNGSRSKDNCYIWIPQNKNQPSICLISKEYETKIWHQKLGHLNLKRMNNIIYEESIKGLPKLKIEEGKICGDLQIGNQKRVSFCFYFFSIFVIILNLKIAKKINTKNVSILFSLCYLINKKKKKKSRIKNKNFFFS